MRLEQLLLYFMEGIWMVGAGLGFMGISLSIKRVLTIAGIYGLLIHGVRTLYIHYSIPFGTHSFVLIALFALLLILIGKQKALFGIIASLVSFLLLFIGENFIFINFLNITNIDIAVLLSKTGGTLLAGTIIELPLIIVSIVCYILKIPFINIKDFETAEKA